MVAHPTALRLLLLLFLPLFGLAQNTPAPMNDYHTDWQKADSLMGKGLPKSALDIADRVYAAAKKANNYPQLTKAAMRRVVFSTAVGREEDTFVNLIKSLRADVAAAPAPAKAILQSVLADVYWQYYQSNRYRFMNRTSVAPNAGTTVGDADKVDSDDPRTWDARRLSSVVMELYLASVQDEKGLQQSPAEAYTVVSSPGNAAGRALRPTLYDLLAHKAIDFLSNAEADVTKPIYRFELDKAEYLAEPTIFVKTPITSRDTLSGKFQALLLYQKLVALHLANKDPLVLAAVDAERLAFVHRQSVLPNKEELYRQTLKAQVTRYKNGSGDAEAEYAALLIEALANGNNRPMGRGRRMDVDDAPNAPDSTHRWDRKQAAELARELIKRRPNAYATQRVRPILDNLLRPSLDIQIEEANTPTKPFLVRVAYANVKTLFYKIVRVTPDEAQNIRTNYYQQYDKRTSQFDLLMDRQSVANGQVALPDDGDLGNHSVEVPVAGLPIGHYAMLISNTGTFEVMTNNPQQIVQVGQFAMSRLAYLEPRRNEESDTARIMYVTDRMTGKPLAGVTVQLWQAITSRTNQTTFKKGSSLKTDEQGKLIINYSQLPVNESYFLRFSQQDDILDSDQQYSYPYNRGNRNKDGDEIAPQARFFTDRAIYRPGQTIHWKALVFRGTNNEFAVVPNDELNVQLRDVNNETVAKITLKTNEFGTASGTFTAPVGRLTGQMTITTTEYIGEASIRVEEYKRPTFAVVAEPLAKAVVVGQTVPVRVVAKTLAGANLDGATVAYRVTRTYYQPYWGGGWWWRPYRPSPEQEIANGTATTDADGVASLTFVAVPDRSIAQKDKPQFTYTVTIDVTDQSGETRSTTQSLRIGYAPFSVGLPLPGTVLTTDKTTYAVRLTNASGNTVGLKQGSVRISRLTPTRPGPLRKRLWERPDRDLLTRAEFEKQFPLDLYADEDNPATWTKTLVRTTDPRSVTLAGLAPGTYAAEVTAQDSTGKTGEEMVYFTVRDEQVPTPSERIGEFVQPIKITALPGQEAVFWVGSSTGEPVLMAVEEQGRPITEQWLLPKPGKPLRIALPVTDRQRGGFMVHFASVQNGRLLSQSQQVSVPFTSKQLTVETETFRDNSPNRLQPGQPEQWTLRVSGPNKDKVLAEMVATLYDASLDEFAKLDWADSFYTGNSFAANYWQSSAFGIERPLEYSSRAGTDYPKQIIRDYPLISWYPYNYDPYRGRFSGGFAYATELTISGTVQNGLVQGVIGAEMGGFPGITVSWKGTTSGTTTDVNGRFSLKKSAGNNVLRFSFVGYKTVEIKLDKKQSFSAKFQSNNSGLNEVVVVGYGIQQRRDITGAVSKVSARSRGDYSGANSEDVLAAPMAADAASGMQVQELREAVAAEQVVGQQSGQASPPPVIRKNFNETAFFFPQLLTDKEGRVVLKFTMPEALTRWRLMTFAHTKTMQTGSFEATAQTQKELMVTTNVPRFFRENDTLRLTARIDNLSGKPLSGTAKLDLTDALTGESLNAKLGLKTLNQAFSTKTGQSAVAVWTLVMPQSLPPVAVRVTAQAGNFSDGEERVVPVLPNRILVTDAQPIWIDGGSQAKTFRLKPLVDRSPELPMQTERLTVEVTNNPAWYALQSLPYLMDYQYDCAEQLFSKLYANALGAHIMNSRPEFRKAVDIWKQTPPKSPLLKNEELRAVTIENTPWLAEATSETERMAKLGQFFDQNTLAAEQRRALNKLKDLQDGNGGLTWFPGMRSNIWMTLHVLAGLGHLQKMGVQFSPDLAPDIITLQQKGLVYIDADARQKLAEHNRAEQQTKQKTVPYWAAFYLYGRSYYQAKSPLDKAFLAELIPAITNGWQGGSLQGQAMSAMTLFRYGYTKEATAILQSLTEHSKISDELGMYWPENVSGTYWYQAPVETQAYLIEAYLEAGKATNSAGDVFAWYRKQPAYAQTTDNQPFIDKMRQWLIQQKRTQSWPSTKATTEAIYALLLNGSDWMDTKATTTVRLGGQDIAKRVTATEALTGYQKVSFAPAEVTQQMGVIEVSKSAKTGISWGGVYWQHFEPLDAVQRGSNNLTVRKNIFRVRNTDAGPVLEPITPQTPLKPGDKLSVRVVLTTDRAMEYVHLKDGRASGFEPVATLSGTKYQNGLSYYEAPRDASTDFFIERLPVGTHVFEYNLRVVHGGDFSTGIAEVQCFYAPEFAAHSTGTRVVVK
ncbi:carboxypeptidase-like regulatory domain-containing protein [Fibrella sp. HMF5335]|uniref:Carboxypeptidase-like regulatory domain-containing protein n=1 Tax=Fibrella rubiginis TaxID=2817060 RepID=A0A939K5J2_9BACT|nr:alpha-2-macroglobulin family protein [Fibrella rubiginis]MBO0937823.1 carboxypeptidase-like regulatory domain-containing protein [Fibrella rubiginis]